MTTRDIPRDSWRTELDSFSRQHEGWIVRVRVTEPDGRARLEADNLPLQGVSAATANGDIVAVSVGQTADDHVTHEIAGPVSISIEKSADGSERALSIRGGDGSTTMVEFQAPKLR